MPLYPLTHRHSLTSVRARLAQQISHCYMDVEVIQVNSNNESAALRAHRELQAHQACEARKAILALLARLARLGQTEFRGRLAPLERPEHLAKKALEAPQAPRERRAQQV